jgi:hypothetical protein
MSSSRSVAAARARRAPETPSQSALKPQMGQQRQPLQQQQLPSYAQQVAANKDSQMKQSKSQQSVVENKLSVSDAFALVTLRLGRVELLLQKWQSLGVESESGVHIPAATSSTPDVNNTIVKSLVSRIDDLERSVKAAVSMKDFEAKISMLSDRNTHLHNELRDAKDTIFKLQTITLETSQKMMKMMMSKSASEVFAAPSSVETPDVIVEDVELDETYDVDQQIVDGFADEENVSLQVEGQQSA